MRARGPHSRDVMSQPTLSPGGGWRWDSEDPRMEVELNQWWRDDGQAPNHVENKPCSDPRLLKHSLLSVQQGTEEGIRVHTRGSCLLASVLRTHTLSFISRCYLSWQGRKVKLERRKKGTFWEFEPKFYWI